MAKSSICYNRSASTEHKKAIEEACAISNECGPGKYLGVLAKWGRSKKEYLGYLKDRIQDRLQGWKACTINKEGMRS